MYRQQCGYLFDTRRANFALGLGSGNLFQEEDAPDGIMVGVVHFVDLTSQRFHVAGIEDMVDLKPKEVLVVGDTYAVACFGEGILQVALDFTMGV